MIDDILYDREFWEAFRQAVTRRARPMFREAYMIGAALAAREKPVGGKEALGALGLLMRVPDLALMRMTGIKADIPGLDPDGMPLPEPGGLTSLPFDYDAIAAGTDEIIGAYTDDWWLTIEASTRERMRAVLRRAASEGLTIPQITRELEPLFGEARAARVAVAETTNLLGMGAQETYRRAGFDGWIWRTARDSLVDPVCEELGRQSDPKRGGRPFPMSRRFQRAHIGCRCWPVPAGKPTVATLPGANPSVPEAFRPA